MRKRIFFAAVTLLLLSLTPAEAQDSPPTTLDGPVNALWAEGETLYIGQGSSLLWAQVTPDAVQVRIARDLGYHEVRAIARSDAALLVLTEDGVVALDAAGAMLDFLPGGGQQMVAAGGRAYIAAREVGVRVVAITPQGKLAALGTIATLGPALDVWLSPDNPTALWVAENQGGVRLYATADPQAPQLLLWLPDQAPATRVRLAGARLYVAHGSDLSALDMTDPTAPRFLSTVNIDAPVAAGPDVTLADLAVVGSRIFAARSAPDGPDLVEFELAGDGPLRIVSRLGESGAGERLVLRGDTLFLGAARGGLQRVYIGRGNPLVVARWPANTLAAPAVCSASQPEPADLTIVESDEVVLSWQSACPEGQTLIVNGTPVPPEQIAQAEDGRFRYTFRPTSSLIIWQVAGPDAARPVVWRFNVEPPGWTTPALPTPAGEMLYQRPLLDLRGVSPAGLVALTCLALCGSLGLIVGAAWLLGARVQRRSTPRL